MINGDNQAVVSVLNSGKTQDLTLAAITRNILMDIYDIELQVVHFLEVDNKIADLFSGWYIYIYISHNLGKIYIFWPNPVWLHLPVDSADID